MNEVWYIRPGWAIEEMTELPLRQEIATQWGHGVMPAMASRMEPPKNEDGTNCQRPTKTWRGDPIPQLCMVENVAVVPVQGPMVKGASGFMKWAAGVCSHEDIAEDLRNAVALKPNAIVMRVNSPGGTVQGTQGVADLVASIVASGMKVVSYTEDQKCSAAEYITGACTARLATSDAIVGSIGTMLATVSLEKMLNRIGVQFNIFASGKYKAMGHWAKDLTSEQEQFLQSFVNERAAEFKKHMTTYRPGIKPEVMQGQIFTGSEGARNGLIDATVKGFGDVLEFVS